MSKCLDPFRFLLISLAGWMNQQWPTSPARSRESKEERQRPIYKQLRGLRESQLGLGRSLGANATLRLHCKCIGHIQTVVLANFEVVDKLGVASLFSIPLSAISRWSLLRLS